ncbi:MAG: SpoVR family protein, partial [Desulfobulbaceae bacterium]|nr:SpoVR family protein [Desulfobulbaceae bacterium]
SLYFQPQIRTKILNEGWASYWHEELFLKDDRIKGHEVEFAIVNAKVTSMPRVGLNPYALGMRLFSYLKSQADKGRISFNFNRISDQFKRRKYDTKVGTGKEFIFAVREDFSDSMFINAFVDQDFVDQYKLFVVEKRLNRERMTWEYYIKSKRAADYKNMVADSLYHPPSVVINVDENNTLILNHLFEKKPLVREYLEATLMGVEFLWGGKVCLYTAEPEPVKKESGPAQTAQQETVSQKIKWKRFRYTMKDRKMTRVLVDNGE